MNKPLIGAALVLAILTTAMLYNNVSFYNNRIDTLWIVDLIFLLGYSSRYLLKKINKFLLTGLILIISGWIILKLNDLKSWTDNVYKFEGGYKIKASVYITGFMDAGTVFKVYRKIPGWPFLEQLTGSAANMTIDYIHRKPKPEIMFTGQTVIVVSDRNGNPISDTLYIKTE